MSARISLEQSTGLQGQWKQQGKTQNVSQANPSINYNQYNSNNQQNSINSIMTNYNSANQSSPYTQPTSLQPIAIPISLSLAAGNDQNILTKYGFQALNQTTGKINEQNSIGNQITNQQQVSQNMNLQNQLSQNYLSNSQNGILNSNIAPITSNYQSSSNYYSNISNGVNYSNSNQQQNNIQNINNNVVSNIVVGSGSSSLNNIGQHQQNFNPSGSSSLNQISNYQSSGNSLSYIGASTSPNIQNNNTQINTNNPQNAGISQIKVKNPIRSSGELKDKAIDQDKQNEQKESKNLQEKSPTTLGQQIQETLVAQSNQTQQNQQNILQQQQQLQNQSSQSQQQYQNIISQFYSSNPSQPSNGGSQINNNFSSSSNYNSLQTVAQNNEQTRINHHSGNSTNKNNNFEININSASINSQNTNQDNNVQSINSSRYSSSNYSSAINNGTNSNSSSQQLQQNNNTRNSGVRNHTLERSDHSRSGNLNTKVQNSFLYNKGNNTLNSSSGAASSSSTMNQNSTNNNLFRKSLEYNQSTQLAGISALNQISNNHIQSTTINLYNSTQQPSSQLTQNQQQININKPQNLKSSNSYNIYSKEANQIEQNNPDTKFIDFYNKTKSPRDQLQSINKSNKEKSYNITDYEAINQQNQLQQPQQNTNQTSSMRLSQNSNNQFLTGSFTNLSMKTQDASQNIQGYATSGIEQGSRSLERKIQPSSSKNGSSTNLSSKQYSYNQGKLNQGLQQLQSELTLSQKYNGRQGHHISTISNTNKHQKTSRSNTPIKSSTNSNLISPNPSFLGTTPAITIGSVSQLSASNNQQQGVNIQQYQQNKPNLLQIEINNLMSKSQQSPNYLGYKKLNEQNTKISPSNSTDKIQQMQSSKQQQNNYHSNHNQSLAGQIVQINNIQQSDIVSKQSPGSSQNLQSQTSKPSLMSSTVTQITQVHQTSNIQQTQTQPLTQGQPAQQLLSQASNADQTQNQQKAKTISSTNLDNLQLYSNSQLQFPLKSPQNVKDKSDNLVNKQLEKQININIHQEEKPKSQTTISPSGEKIGSTNNFEYKSLASRYNHDAIQNFLDTQNARIASNQLTLQSQQIGTTQIDKRSTSMNKANQHQQIPSTDPQNPFIQNLNGSKQQVNSGGNNHLFISSNLDFNNQHTFDVNNTQSKSKSPVNQQKATTKVNDFSQAGSSNKLDSSSKVSTTLGQKFSYKPLTLNTEEANHSTGSLLYNQQMSSKNKNNQNLQQQINSKQSVSNNEDQSHFNQVQQLHQSIPSSQQLQEQQQHHHQQQQQHQNQQQSNQARSSFTHGTTNQITLGSPYTQSNQNKSIDKIKKSSHSNMKLYSDKKSLNNLSTKSPKSANNNSFLQQYHQQASATSSNANDNSITYPNIKRFEQTDQNNTSNISNTQSPFTKKQVDEQLTPNQALYSVEGGYKTNNSLYNDNSYSNISPNLYKNSPLPSNMQSFDMVKIKEKMKKILEQHSKKENLLQNENQELKNQITKLKQTINNQQGEITQLKSQLNSNSQFQNNNNNNNFQLQMSFQNLFNQDYSATKNQLSPRSTLLDTNQVFQSPLEISFQQHQ